MDGYLYSKTCNLMHAIKIRRIYKYNAFISSTVTSRVYTIFFLFLCIAVCRLQKYRKKKRVLTEY